LRPAQSVVKKFLFAGVVAAVFFREEANRPVVTSIPSNCQGMMMGSEMIDLGLVIKSQSVLEVINAYLGKWRD